MIVQEIQLASGQVLKGREVSIVQGFLVVRNGEDPPRWINLSQVAEMRGVADAEESESIKR